MQLYDKEEIQLKRDEPNIIQGFLTSLHDLQTKVISDENNLRYVVKILQKRFGQTLVKDFDIARGNKGDEESRKVKTKKRRELHL